MSSTTHNRGATESKCALPTFIANPAPTYLLGAVIFSLI